MSSATALKHGDGVVRMERHEREDNGAQYTLPEPPRLPRVYGVEDLIAWLWGVSTVDEWKNSLSDLHADREKPQRKPGTLAVGHYRYYASDAYVIEPHQVEDAWGWGLKWRWPETDQIEVVKEAPPWHRDQVDQWAENMLLIAAAKRAERAAGTTAQEARPSNKNKLPKWVCDRIREALGAMGEMSTIRVSSDWLSDWTAGGSAGVRSKKISAYSKNPGIDGVTYSVRAGVTYLQRKEGE